MNLLLFCLFKKGSTSSYVEYFKKTLILDKDGYSVSQLLYEMWVTSRDAFDRWS